jgi:hypothetical protein
MSDFSYALDVFILAHFWLIFTPIMVISLAIAISIYRASGRVFRAVKRHPDFRPISTSATYGSRSKSDHYNREGSPQNPAYLDRYRHGNVSK